MTKVSIVDVHAYPERKNNFYYKIKTEITTKFSTLHFTFNQILSRIKVISGSSYTCFRIFEQQVNLGKLEPSTPSHVEEHT